MPKTKAIPDSLAEDRQRTQTAPKLPRTQEVVNGPMVSTPAPATAGDGDNMTVINSDGTTTTYTASGKLLDGEQQRPSEATKAVTDSDRVTAKGSVNVRSKKTERMKRKLEKKKAKSAGHQPTHLLDLPNEILFNIFIQMRPSEVLGTLHICRAFHDLVQHNEALLSRHIVSARYPVLAKCFRLPVSLDDIDPKLHVVLQYETRIQMLGIHRRYQHIPQPDPFTACTCLTCVLRWQALFTIIDFNYWQENLASGKPIPVIPRDQIPEWNKTLKERTARIVLRALKSPLIHARILEMHLVNTCAAIKRQTENRGNRRRHFTMTQADEDSGTDSFLEQEGPSTADMPFQRDGYDLLEVYLPTRTWLKNETRWAYMPADIHDRDLAWAATRWNPVFAAEPIPKDSDV
ncbi:F-box domain-containing protein [Colletotrichum higginsianum IMI 349063]|uniref:F-box domain-containing protein n=3 Tax=Colletotrichum higginsianum (strain IMI 349063) TaxID=759273 RepID=A0A1B7YSD3_COLHI|nr:F-box domain-containing protein [Colletotrichum higginsianum IMI 349063]OBR14959.1 F-box domain-containing protein [Colletotrichum higginsianum IMI 349063]